MRGNSIIQILFYFFYFDFRKDFTPPLLCRAPPEGLAMTGSIEPALLTVKAVLALSILTGEGRVSPDALNVR